MNFHYFHPMDDHVGDNFSSKGGGCLGSRSPKAIQEGQINAPHLVTLPKLEAICPVEQVAIENDASVLTVGHTNGAGL